VAATAEGAVAHPGAVVGRGGEDGRQVWGLPVDETKRFARQHTDAHLPRIFALGDVLLKGPHKVRLDAFLVYRYGSPSTFLAKATVVGLFCKTFYVGKR
jgi:hypothetical protein